MAAYCSSPKRDSPGSLAEEGEGFNEMRLAEEGKGFFF